MAASKTAHGKLRQGQPGVSIAERRRKVKERTDRAKSLLVDYPPGVVNGMLKEEFGVTYRTAETYIRLASEYFASLSGQPKEQLLGQALQRYNDLEDRKDARVCDLVRIRERKDKILGLEPQHQQPGTAIGNVNNTMVLNYHTHEAGESPTVAVGVSRAGDPLSVTDQRKTDVRPDIVDERKSLSDK